MSLITQVVCVIRATSHSERFDSGRDIIHAALLLSVSVEWIIPELFRFKGFNNNKFAILRGQSGSSESAKCFDREKV